MKQLLSAKIDILMLSSRHSYCWRAEFIVLVTAAHEQILGSAWHRVWFVQTLQDVRWRYVCASKIHTCVALMTGKSVQHSYTEITAAAVTRRTLHHDVFAPRTMLSMAPRMTLTLFRNDATDSAYFRKRIGSISDLSTGMFHQRLGIERARTCA